ncbi:hypothetical protein ACFFJN_06245 [Erwinia mallotivora]|uniref:hypothetical protein n=1 Tax=Erwinia mallotivora TaxID=69222 RepID=UPI0035E59F8B
MTGYSFSYLHEDLFGSWKMFFAFGEIYRTIQCKKECCSATHKPLPKRDRLANEK